jgi:acyl-CoA synthetase (AMP-forming)/AMP-acid ligase II
VGERSPSSRRPPTGRPHLANAAWAAVSREAERDTPGSWLNTESVALAQVVKAFIVTDAIPTEALAEELQSYVRARLGNYRYPRSIEFVDSIPTTTGKRMRRALIGEGHWALIGDGREPEIPEASGPAS